MTRRRVLLHTMLVASAVSIGARGPAWAGPITVLTPATGEKAYPIAGATLAGLWEQVPGRRPVVKIREGAASQDQKEKLPEGDLVLIGSDAVHPLVHQLIRRRGGEN